jgi:hypothetical protein
VSERWVVDASPLIVLGTIGRLDLLTASFTRPIRVHFRYDSRARFPRLRRPDHSDSRPGRYLLNGQFAG